MCVARLTPGRNVPLSGITIDGKMNWAGGIRGLEPWLATVIILAGAVVRLAHLPFSISDTRSGGLFLAFAREIADSSYLLPEDIPHYTDGGLPFAYPPLSFYLEAMLAYGAGIPEHVVVNALPPSIAVVSLLSFHVLTRVMRLRSDIRLISLFVFAVSWAAFEHQIEAGGLAEAAGTLTLIWLATAFAGLKKSPHTISHWHILTGAALGLCIMASPGSAYASILLAAIFSTYHLANTRNFRPVITVAIVSLLVSFPYWVPVLLNHGPGVITTSLAGQHERSWLLGSLTQLLSFSVLWSPTQAFAARVAVAAGMAHEILKRRWWIGIWLVICLFTPREGSWMASIPGSILAGIGIVWLAHMWLDYLLRTGRRLVAITPVVLALVSLVVLGVSAAGYKVHQEATSGSRTPEGFREALAASTTLLPADAKVLTLVESEDWSPLWIQRTVLNMPYGAEWQPRELATIEAFQAEMRDCENLQCVNSVADTHFDYAELFVVMRRERLFEFCDTLRDCDSLELVQETGDTVVAALRPIAQ